MNPTRATSVLPVVRVALRTIPTPACKLSVCTERNKMPHDVISVKLGSPSGSEAHVHVHGPKDVMRALAIKLAYALNTMIE